MMNHGDWSSTSTGADAPPQAKKRRKQRPCLSCEECRRLKMKCDRQVPCTRCVQRNRASACVQAAQTLEHSEQDGASRHADASMALSLMSGRSAILSSPTTQNPFDRVPASFTETPVRPYGANVEYTDAYRTHNSTSPSLPMVGVPALRLPDTSGAVAESRSQIAPSNGQEEGGYGTLVISEGGGAKYLGPTAMSGWLKDTEANDVEETPPMTRAPSAEPSGAPNDQQTFALPRLPTAVFPFSNDIRSVRTSSLLARLPAREEAKMLVESYYRYCSWHHDVIPRAAFDQKFDKVYASTQRGATRPAVSAQDLALVFIVLAQGTMFNIEMPDNDPSAEEWLRLSEVALVKGDFLSKNTTAGIQTLHLMAHLHLHIDKGHRGDNSYPLWGLVMRIVLAMGMHRDGTVWRLPEDILEERRKVFWEVNAADVFLAHCFSRPSSINVDHCDTAFPTVPLTAAGAKTYTVLRFELSQLAGEVLNEAMKVRKPPYSAMLSLHRRLMSFEESLPFYIRCRASLVSMPSRFLNVEDAFKASPEPSKHQMTLSLQQTNLSLNISETVINLNRPYYAKALHNEKEAHLSVYAESYLAVIERCVIIIAIVDDIHSRYPTVSTRQWNFWHHVFNSALCLATLVLRDSTNSLTGLVLDQLDKSVHLFESLLKHGASAPRYIKNHRWLIRLRARVVKRVAAASQPLAISEPESRNRDAEDNDDGGDLELLGWRTRLIERASMEHQTVRTIPNLGAPLGPAQSAASAGVLDDSPTDQTLLAEGPSLGVPGPGTGRSADSSTDLLLHDFWDPLLGDVLGVLPANSGMLDADTSNWWEEITGTAAS